MKKRTCIIALACAIGFLGLGVQSSYGLLAEAQGKTSLKPSAPIGTTLYKYQMNCDPVGVNTFTITYTFGQVNFSSNFDVASFRTVTPTTLLSIDDVTFINGYQSTDSPEALRLAIDNANNSDLSTFGKLVLHGQYNPDLGAPGEDEVDVFSVKLNTSGLGLHDANGNPLTDANGNPIEDPTLAGKLFEFSVGTGPNDSIANVDGVPSDTIIPTFLDLTTEQLLAPVPLPSSAWGGMVLLAGLGAVGFLRSRRQPS